jgi:hypothetical protein
VSQLVVADPHAGAAGAAQARRQMIVRPVFSNSTRGCDQRVASRIAVRHTGAAVRAPASVALAGHRAIAVTGGV